jgi:hypothetical protein
MRKDLYPIFANFCSTHPRISINSLFACYEQMEKYKSIENMGERKALGCKIYESYFKKDSPFKVQAGLCFVLRC